MPLGHLFFTPVVANEESVSQLRTLVDFAWLCVVDLIPVQDPTRIFLGETITFGGTWVRPVNLLLGRPPEQQRFCGRGTVATTHSCDA